MAHRSDMRTGGRRDVPMELRRIVARVLGMMAERYAGDVEPGARVENLEFVKRAGLAALAAFKELGDEAPGDRVRVVRLVRASVGDTGRCTRGELAQLLPVLAAEWGEDDNEPVIPRFPKPRRPQQRVGVAERAGARR